MNFKFLQPFLKLRKLYEYCCEAEEFALTKPNISATSARKGMEFIVKMIYASLTGEYGVSVFEMVTDIRFVIVGDGMSAKDVKQSVSEMELDGMFFFEGFTGGFCGVLACAGTLPLFLAGGV